MGSTGGTREGSTEPRRERLFWRVGVPLGLVAPAFALVPVEPLASLGYLALLLLPIGLLGGKMGDHGYVADADPRSIEGPTVDLAGNASPVGDRVGVVGWRVGVLGLASFVLIAVFFA